MKDGKLIGGLRRLGLSPSERQLWQVERLFGLLQKWNRAYNLTRIVSWEGFLTHHLFDSLTALPHLEGDRVLDVGTGAGFPGLPLALFSPERRFVLLDAVAKKVDFVEMAVEELGLNNVEAVHSRIEGFWPKVPFPTVVSRAVASLAELWQLCHALLAARGVLMVYKGRYPEEELQALPEKVKATVLPVEVPFLKAERHLAILRKIDK